MAIQTKICIFVTDAFAIEPLNSTTSSLHLLKSWWVFRRFRNGQLNWCTKLKHFAEICQRVEVVFRENSLPNGKGLSITLMVISYAFPSEYFRSVYSEPSFIRRALIVEWNSKARSFKPSKQPPLSLKALWDGQQPTGGTLIIPIFFAPSSRILCKINKAEQLLQYALEHGSVMDLTGRKRRILPLFVFRIQVPKQKWTLAWVHYCLNRNN